ncbi:MAG: hypothetical protein M1828_002432 [Chrysothrix sp. TS-e1954]|nr:MAG: hypothetical protein M1828_002432 [Chrysothrix sp. TS-e1954]
MAMEARNTSISPQPVAVDATVAAVTAAFGHASKLLQQVKARRIEASAELYLLPLEQSISRGLRGIDNEWEEGTERFGAAFELGDRTTAWALQKIVTELRVMLIGALRAAIDDPAHSHLDVALNASDLARKEVVRTLSDLYGRLLQKPPAKKIPSVKRFPSGQIVEKRMTFLSMSTSDDKTNSISSFAQVHELSFLKEYRKSGQLSSRPESEDVETRRRGRQSSLFERFRQPSALSNINSPLPSYKSGSIDSTGTLETITTQTAALAQDHTFFDDLPTPKYGDTFRSSFKFPHESMMSQDSAAREGTLTPIKDESPPATREPSDLSPGNEDSKQDYSFPLTNENSTNLLPQPLKISDESRAVLDELPSEDAVQNFSRSFLKPSGLDPDAQSKDEHDQRIDSLLQQLHSLDVNRHFSTSTAGSELSHISFPEHAVRSSAASTDSDFFIAGKEVRLSKPPPPPKTPPPPPPALDVVSEEEEPRRSPTQREASAGTLDSTATERPEATTLSPNPSANQPPPNSHHTASAPALTHPIPPMPRAPSSPKASSDAGDVAHRRRRPSTKYMPVPSATNNYLDFCPSAWRLQNGDREALKPAAFMGPVMSKATSNICTNSKCAFRDSASSDSKIWEQDGVRFRRAFFAKSHVQVRRSKNGMFTFQCMFCAFHGVLGKECQFLGADRLLEHLATHRGEDLDDTVLTRARCIADKVAGDEDAFDVNLTPLDYGGEAQNVTSNATNTTTVGGVKVSHGPVDEITLKQNYNTNSGSSSKAPPPAPSSGARGHVQAQGSGTSWLSDMARVDSEVGHGLEIIHA